MSAVEVGRWRAAATALPDPAPDQGGPLSLSGILDGFPRTWPAAVSTVFWVVLSAIAAYGGFSRSDRPVVLVAGLGTALLLGVVGYLLLRWYVRRLAVLALAWMAIAGLVTHFLAPSAAGATFGYVAVWVAAVRERLWTAAVLAVVGLAGTLTVDAVRGRLDPTEALVTAAAYALGFVFALVLRSSRDARRRVAQAREDAAVAQARTVVLDERARIAREIHDILAHTLSAQSVQLEAARLLLRRDGGHPEVADRLEQAQRMTREGMEETRRAVHALRGDGLPAPDLLAEVARDAGLAFRTEGEPRDLSPEVSLAVLRAGQEAVANVRKHAPDARGTMVLRYDDGSCGLDVTDDGGSGPGPLTRTGSGYGLTGIRERAELLGGSLDAGPDGAGFALRLRLPA